MQSFVALTFQQESSSVLLPETLNRTTGNGSNVAERVTLNLFGVHIAFRL